MRSRLLLPGLLPLVVALAACGGGGTPAPAKPAGGANALKAKSVTIKVTSVAVTSDSGGKPRKVVKVGDKVGFEDVLLNAAPQFGKQKNEKVGSDKGTETFTSLTTATMHGVANLPDGTITFDGDVTMRPDSTITVPVVGGTGKYANASGTLHVGHGKTQAPNTYTLLIENIAGPSA